MSRVTFTGAADFFLFLSLSLGGARDQPRNWNVIDVITERERSIDTYPERGGRRKRVSSGLLLHDLSIDR